MATCWWKALAAVVAAVAVSSCGAGGRGPATADAQTTCRSCRMSVADVRFAGQIVAEGREPMFFDDLGCLRGFLAHGTDVPATLQVYVADHLTRDWVTAESAVFTRVEGLDTPMGSGVIAHASAQSRDSDPAARGGVAVPAAEFFPARSLTRPRRRNRGRESFPENADGNDSRPLFSGPLGGSPQLVVHPGAGPSLDARPPRATLSGCHDFVFAHW